MKLYNKISFAIVAVAMIIFATPVAAQYYPIGWHKVSSSMSSDSIWIAGNDGHNSAKFLRTSFNGAFGDTVTWVLEGLDIPYEGWFQSSVRGSNEWGNNSGSLTISDGITTETVGGFAGAFSQWSTTQYHNDSPSISHITTIIIKEFFYIPPGDGPVSIDWDDFQVKIGGVWQSAYQCGDVGNLYGTIWSDSSGNGVREPGELPLAGWKLYLTGTVTDSTVSDSAGHYRFLDLPQGNYVLTSPVPDSGWVQTKPLSGSYNVTLSSETLLVTADFGNKATAAHAFRVRRGWNMVGVPLVVPDFSKQALFSNATSAAFSYNGSGYQVENILKNGTGYWIKFDYEQLVLMEGSEFTNDTVDVTDGWNMISGISQPIRTDQVTTDEPGMTVSSFFGYKGVYSPTDSLQPGSGYWVKANKSGRLMFNSNPPAMVASNRVRIVHTDELPPAAPGEQATSGQQRATSFALGQNYPNPFNPSTVIKFTVDSRQFTVLKVYNLLGQEVATLIEEMKEPGSYQVEWNAAEQPSGMYFYRLSAGTYRETNKMLLLK